MSTSRRYERGPRGHERAERTVAAYGCALHAARGRATARITADDIQCVPDQLGRVAAAGQRPDGGGARECAEGTVGLDDRALDAAELRAVAASTADHIDGIPDERARMAAARGGKRHPGHQGEASERAVVVNACAFDAGRCSASTGAADDVQRVSDDHAGVPGARLPERRAIDDIK